jgi:hypothetical protein
MTFPADWTKITVTGTYLRRDGTPASGRVNFSAPQIVTVGGQIIVPTGVVGELDENGSITVDLPATDDPDITPAGWTWTVEEIVQGLNRAPFDIEVPHGGGGIDLATVAPAVPAGEVSTLATQAYVADAIAAGGALTGALEIKPATNPSLAVGTDAEPLAVVTSVATFVSGATGYGAGFFKSSPTVNGVHTVTIRQASTTAGDNAVALNVVNDNPSSSAMYITSANTQRAVLKISHTGQSDGSDSGAAAIGIDLTGSGTAAIGLSIIPTNPTTGNLIQIRNNSGVEDLVVKGTGRIGVGIATGATPSGQVDVRPPNASTRAVDYRVSGDSNSRVRIDASQASGGGTISFGDGTTNDVSLYRASTTTLRTNGSVTVDLDTRCTRNAQFGSNTLDVGSGTGCIGIRNAAAIPSASPANGGVLYVEGGALKYRGSSGTVTTIAPA